jgi:homoserine kinase
MFARAPGSSANLGPGFDVLGLAVGIWADVGSVDDLADGEPPDGAIRLDDQHPAAAAFRLAGGVGSIWSRTTIPMGRGLGYSGAVRVAALALGEMQANGALDDAMRQRVFAAGTALEGHPDNVAASVFGGFVAATDERAVVVPIGMALRVVAWVPPSTTSTDSSRRTLPGQVDRADAVYNIGLTAQLVAAIVAGDWDGLRASVDDRLGQHHRLHDVPQSAQALHAFTSVGAPAWLSGSGPTVVAVCPPERVDEVRAAAPDHGHVKMLDVDTAGVVSVDE